jgi:hypothetical protein
MKKQTAIDFLIKNLSMKYTFTNEELEMIKEAKVLERNQIVDSNLNGVETTLNKINAVVLIPDTLMLVENIKKGIDVHDEGHEYYIATYENF